MVSKAETHSWSDNVGCSARNNACALEGRDAMLRRYDQLEGVSEQLGVVWSRDLDPSCVRKVSAMA